MSDLRICPDCHTENPAKANYCRNCGHQFNEFSLASLEKENERLKERIHFLMHDIKSLDCEIERLKSAHEHRHDAYELRHLKVQYALCRKVCIILGIALVLSIASLCFFVILRSGRNNVSDDSSLLIENVLTSKKEVTDINMGEYKYSGTVENNFPNGYGIAVYDDGRKYTGNFVNGKRHGRKCKFTFSNGDVFEGEFADDKIYNGIFTSKQKDSFNSTFTGLFQNNEPYSGTWKDADGSVILVLENGAEKE